MPQDCDPVCTISLQHFVNYLTYQSLWSSDVQSGCQIGARGPQAVLWHLREAERWKAVWLLSSSCKYPQSPRRALAVIGSVPFSLRTLCFIKINDKATVYADAYLCLAPVMYLKRHASQLLVAERSARRRISKAKRVHYNKYQCFHFSSGLGLFVSQHILCDSPELDSIIITQHSIKRDVDKHSIFLWLHQMNSADLRKFSN